MSVDYYMQVKGDAGRPRLTSAGRCVQATSDASRPRPTKAYHFMQVKRDVGNKHLTFFNCCVQANRDVGSLRTIMIKQCAQAMANAGNPWPTSTERCATGHNRCGRSITSVVLPMSLVICGCFLLEEHIPWLMLPTICRCRCHPTYAHTRRLMVQALADVAFSCPT